MRVLDVLHGNDQVWSTPSQPSVQAFGDSRVFCLCFCTVSAWVFRFCQRSCIPMLTYWNMLCPCIGNGIPNTTGRSEIRAKVSKMI